MPNAKNSIMTINFATSCNTSEWKRQNRKLMINTSSVDAGSPASHELSRWGGFLVGCVSFHLISRFQLSIVVSVLGFAEGIVVRHGT